MKVVELIAAMQKADPRLFNAVPERQAIALVRSVFRQVNAALGAATEGNVKFAGLGRFKIRQVVKDVEGKQVTRKNIRFIPGEPGKRGKKAPTANKAA